MNFCVKSSFQHYICAAYSFSSSSVFGSLKFEELMMHLLITLILYIL